MNHLKNFCFSRSNRLKRCECSTSSSLTDSSKYVKTIAMFEPISSSNFLTHSGYSLASSMKA